jgi:hypothetical protein
MQPPNPGQNPYAPPTSDAWNDTHVSFEEAPQGTYWGGFAAGFFFAWLGVLIVHFAGKSETKTGSWHGFGARLGFAVIAGLVAAAAS